jgi:predicted enzyme related to lactoylglutathione lyase
MADPFEALSSPTEPLSPDPVFAARLRSRLQRAIDLPKGVTVSDITLEHEHRTATGRVVSRRHEIADEPAEARANALTPYLAVAGAHQALSWYEEAFGARRRGELYVMPDGTIGHAELEIAGGVLMLAEESPRSGVEAPLAGRGAAVTIHLSVHDVDTVIGRAVEHGATLERAPADYEYGRNGVIRDPFGHRWLVASEPQEPADTLRQGDLAYTSLFVPDLRRAGAFFSSVLGWRYAPGSGEQGLQVEEQSLHHGLWGDQERGSLFLCFAVDDIDAAVGRVRDAGGTAEGPHEEPYGFVSSCTDDQETPFAVFQIPGSGRAAGAEAAGRPPQHGSLQGDLAYVTIEVVDSTRARAFYGEVLGWRFAPGRVPDGWQVEDTAPMCGMSGGHELATVVPMYRVDDIADAVRRVRAGGGSASDPEAQPYGITSQCIDDQGTRFYLGQL